ncbi:zinc finger CW-type PWWP domain protein 2 isoform X3 [Lagenorhynchus albirostris]|uniref:zinc finger CW-type PWWP domain protein 2 isoform X3 n=1 Tax=Lagenorhynchus albirostris TaxID=27610 RepID=UPI0028EE600D|nr:zinc finger CW-type PWWP domain protein 2 isoform X3 [Lagenorhynchus albirostris]
MRGKRLNAFMEKGKLNSKMIAEYCNMAMDSSVENNIYVNKVWVQCENESCLKWRLLSSEDAAKVDHNESWYCFMNTDLRYNKCSVSEEDFPEESQLHQSGFKIVYSQLPLGSLVLVKLQNWPRQIQSRWQSCCGGQERVYGSDFNQTDLLVGASCFQGFQMQVSKNNTQKKKPKFRKRKAILKSSFENVCSDDALSKENMVVSETELLLKELEQMLEQAREPTAAPDESKGERREETDTGEKLSKCGPEAPVGSSLENHCDEDYLVIDGLRLKAGECIENITNKFKEIDALMSAF